MQYTISETSMGNRPNVSLPNPIILATLKEEGMRNLISRHYDLLVESKIKDLFPENEQSLAMAKKHSADFFIQICGGPKYFNESRGAPRMVARHMPFKITPSARVVWLEMFAKAIEETNLSEEEKKSFWDYVDIFSIWMINTPEPIN
ncbi:globin [Arcobacter arenosus]|uniref:Globin n=1 Tax=Arcobacter arenosus TaxID=2576037 RepID=A0A5R8XZW4_9BACT|nr:globin [Arcobacter arenosus]TLP37588.1 globin [Arcobacter arenosus]